LNYDVIWDEIARRVRKVSDGKITGSDPNRKVGYTPKRQDNRIRGSARFTQNNNKIFLQMRMNSLASFFIVSLSVSPTPPATTLSPLALYPEFLTVPLLSLSTC
jgi:hypothetical protein